MITIVNVVDAVIVLGMAAFWATNVTDVAIAWMIGDVGNTVLFGFFAFVALRQVGGRWELLGERSGVQAAALSPSDRSAATAQHARRSNMLVTLAEQQHAADMLQAVPQLADGLTGPVLHRRAAGGRTAAGASASRNTYSAADRRGRPRDDRQQQGTRRACLPWLSGNEICRHSPKRTYQRPMEAGRSKHQSR